MHTTPYKQASIAIIANHTRENEFNAHTDMLTRARMSDDTPELCETIDFSFAVDYDYNG